MRDAGARSASADILAASPVGRMDVLRMRNRNGPIRRGTPARVKAKKTPANRSLSASLELVTYSAPASSFSFFLMPPICPRCRSSNFDGSERSASISSTQTWLLLKRQPNSQQKAGYLTPTASPTPSPNKHEPP